MKSKANFLIALVFIVLISLPMVCADENTTQPLSEDNTQTIVCADENTTPTLAEDNSVENVDLSVSLMSNPREDSVDIVWEVTIKNYKGTSKNTEVINEFPDFINIIAYSADCGTFDPATKVWTIGDLTSGTSKRIEFYGIFNNRYGEYNYPFTIYAKAITDCHDTDLSDNFNQKEFKNTVSPTSSQSGNNIHFNLGFYLPSYKYNGYRVSTKTVKYNTYKAPAKKATRTVKKIIKKKVKVTKKKVKKKKKLKKRK